MYVSGATVFCLLPSWQCYCGGLQEIMPKIENFYFSYFLSAKKKKQYYCLANLYSSKLTHFILYLSYVQYKIPKIYIFTP
jgi:hypothetical protein